MKQKKSLIAVALTFALVFSSFSVFPANAAIKNKHGNAGNKKYINKNATPFLVGKEKQKYKGVSRILKKRRKSALQKIDTNTPWKYIKYGKKKPYTISVCSRAMYKTLSPKQKRAVRKAERKLRTQLQAALLAKQSVKLDKHSAWHSCPSAIIACRIANAENQKLYKYNKKARKINKKRYKTAKKRWKKRHKRGKIRYKKMKIKKYLDAKNICKNADVNSFDIDYNVVENTDMPVHDSVQIKLSWKVAKGDTLYHVVKVEEELKTEKITTEETTVNTASYEDSKKYTPDNTFDNAPSVYFVYTKNKGKINVYKQNFEYDYGEKIAWKLAKCDEVEYEKTGVCEGINYFTLLELNRLRNSVGLDSFEYSAEMNKYAQIRAEECEAEFAGIRKPHTRPDGSDPDTVFPKEKIANELNLIKDLKNKKWQIGNEGLSSIGVMGLWNHRAHRNQLLGRTSTYVAIGNYYNFCSITPVVAGEKAVKILEEQENYEKHKEESAREFLAKCGINFNDHLNEVDLIYQMIYPYGKPFADPELIKQVYYKGMSLWVYYEILLEINADESDTPDKTYYEVWRKWIEKHKKYKE